ncbi:MAG TPA: hypothetical protein VGE69_16995 [Pseudomonadales bacterium]
MRHSRKRHWGFGLIEILVTLGVLSVGIVGVTVLHSTVTKQSSENKSRAEALAIAQSRIEDLRNYTGAVASLADFDEEFADTSGFANSATIEGTNAEFTREEQIGSTGDMKTLTVRVTWSDQDGDSQNVSLDTRLSYIPPRSIGDTALQAGAAVVDAPTGRARLGEGELPAGAVTVSNGDGTSLYDNGGSDLMLVAGDQIVLTLAEACQTENETCIDFVRIKGRVWIDQATQGSLNPGNVFVIASDAAYCARHFTPDGATEATPVTLATTSTRMTANGNYEWFDYTCYIGGGWHGNIGILLAGGLRNTDKICVGDPVTADLWAMPEIASRRVYRGMLFKHDDNTASGKEEVAPGFVRYYSQGIADSTELPEPDSGQMPHDFVIGAFNQNLTGGSHCTGQGIMVRTDATVDGKSGGLFEGMPTDFVCLNDGFLDSYDGDVYGHTIGCPYDPSDPPSTSHVVSGSILLAASDTTANDVIAATLESHTSDGPYNCVDASAPAVSHDGTFYRYDYDCTVFDWGNGWNGYIEADYDASKMECDPYRITLADIGGDSANHNFTNCRTGSFAVITGTVTAAGNRKLASASMGANGSCTVAADGLSYKCISIEYTTSTMTFTLTFTPTSGVMCKPAAPHSGVYTYTNQTPGNLEPLNLRIANNTNNC